MTKLEALERLLERVEVKLWSVKAARVVFGSDMYPSDQEEGLI